MAGLHAAGIRGLDADRLHKIDRIGWLKPIDYTPTMRWQFRELIQQVVRAQPDCFALDDQDRYVWLTKDQREAKAEVARAEYESWMATLTYDF